MSASTMNTGHSPSRIDGLTTAISTATRGVIMGLHAEHDGHDDCRGGCLEGRAEHGQRAQRKCGDEGDFGGHAEIPRIAGRHCINADDERPEEEQAGGENRKILRTSDSRQHTAQQPDQRKCPHAGRAKTAGFQPGFPSAFHADDKATPKATARRCRSGSSN
jgi:hypothetical protein